MTLTTRRRSKRRSRVRRRGAALVKVGFAGIASASRIARTRGGAARRRSRQRRSGRRRPRRVRRRGSGREPRARGMVGVAAARGRGACCSTRRTRAVLACAGSWLLTRSPHGWPTRTAGAARRACGQAHRDDLPFVRDAGADIAGVRGAACEGGRSGRVSADRVRLLCAACESPGGQSGGRSADSSAAISSAAITTDSLDVRRQHSREVGVNQFVTGVGRNTGRLDEHHGRRAELAGQPGGNRVARHVPRVGQRIGLLVATGTVRARERDPRRAPRRSRSRATPGVEPANLRREEVRVYRSMASVAIQCAAVSDNPMCASA